MMVLDTNVVSELMRAQPAPSVLAWLDGLPPGDTWLASVVVAELLFGLARLPQGARKDALSQTVKAMLEQDFAGQVLPFDLAAAASYAHLVSQRERLGQPIGMADAQIAATCLAYGAALATRNTRDFADLGLTLVNPWETGGVTAD